MPPLDEVVRNLVQQSSVGGEAVHRLRGALHVHEHDGRQELRRSRQHLWVELAARDVVYPVSTGNDGSARNCCLPGVHAYGNIQPLLADGTDHWDYSIDLLLHWNLRRARFRGLASHVEDVGARPEHGLRGGHGVLKLDVITSITERVRSDVQNTHDQSASATPKQRPPGAPVQATSHGHDVERPRVGTGTWRQLLARTSAEALYQLLDRRVSLQHRMAPLRAQLGHRHQNEIPLVHVGVRHLKGILAVGSLQLGLPHCHYVQVNNARAAAQPWCSANGFFDALQVCHQTR
mmetsp:Transcript_10850/g.22140  ORF Transcript_10850/g.22140 Transcript_10850/m.22140 type:complete len:291 (-) Transcript_10850:277-1149(-)